MLLQDPDDLLFRVPALLHRPSSRLDYEKTPVGPGRDFRGQVKTLARFLGLVYVAASAHGYVIGQAATAKDPYWPSRNVDGHLLRGYRLQWPLGCPARDFRGAGYSGGTYRGRTHRSLRFHCPGVGVSQWHRGIPATPVLWALRRHPVSCFHKLWKLEEPLSVLIRRTNGFRFAD
jgi:hypothetical protein